MTEGDGLLVVGGGPAALSAARGYRDAGGSDPVHLLSADLEAPYVRPALSKEFLRGEIGDDDLPAEHPDFYADNDIALHLDTTVTALDTAARKLHTAAGQTVGYGRCVLATGAKPAVLPVPGADHPEVPVLRSAASARRLRVAVRRAGTVAVIGAGFIGCEAAVSVARTGTHVTIFAPDSLPQQQRIGEYAGRRVLQWLHEEGVHTVLGSEVTGSRDGHTLVTGDGDELTADLVLLATGIRPCARLAADAGLATASGRVRADARLRTAATDVYAAGDVALADNAVAGRPIAVEHWGEALIMGEIAGRNAAGAHQQWENAPGFWTVLGDRTLKYSGWGEGFDTTRVVEHDEGAFTVWYGSGGVTVGVLSHGADRDYERGTELVERAAPLPGRSPVTGDSWGVGAACAARRRDRRRLVRACGHWW